MSDLWLMPENYHRDDGFRTFGCCLQSEDRHLPEMAGEQSHVQSASNNRLRSLHDDVLRSRDQCNSACGRADLGI